jgi:non-homologous end joining protein Ku
VPEEEIDKRYYERPYYIVLDGKRRRSVRRHPRRHEGQGPRRPRRDRVRQPAQKAGHFDPAKFKDEYELALRKLVKRKAAGKPIEAPEAREDPSNVIDLMEALRQSIKGGGRRAAALSSSGRSKKTSEPRARKGRRRRRVA